MASPLPPSTLEISPFRAASNGTNAWVATTPKLRSGVKVRLFCIPYAGGSAAIYRTWQAAFPETVEICPLRLPGREMRLKEPCIRDCRVMLQAITNALIGFTDEPYALFGHSMGGFLAYDLALQFIDQGRRPPSALFIGGRQAPSIIRDILSKPADEISDEELVRDLSAVNTDTFKGLMKNQELAKLVVPILRADFEVCQSYRYTPHPPIDVPMTILGGTLDPSVHQADLEPWRDTVTGPFSLHMVEGDHFFVVNAANAVQRIVAEKLQSSLLSASRY